MQQRTWLKYYWLNTGLFLIRLGIDLVGVVACFVMALLATAGWFVEQSIRLLGRVWRWSRG